MKTKYDIYTYENDLNSKGYKYIAGTDEAGRGPMAGPLVASAVILPIGYRLEGINDSKQLTPKSRDKFYDIIMRDALAVEVEVISVEDVDRINVLEASRLAMTRCLKRLKIKPDYVLTDCMKVNVDAPVLDLIKGDAKSATIAAASIIAKVTRDRIMIDLDKIYPEYGFKKHKGYVTKYHLEMLEKYGVTAVHRLSFAPVMRVIEMNKKY